ncbi:ChaN family lipoprotein [Arcicella aquatica]|uniref:ChaN family lipoprotein n=1 Tax=Arcicella aquatica TaxID=217141 RepID=A0ABU5QUJ9_9BACT|nr:ChaN family lipoprotein [Arcicella aquatica]MEA5260771.1 ChaN family lipoprotein [Arcicella aquatica]
MKTYLYAIAFLLFTCSLSADKPAYMLYNKQLKETSYQKMMKELATADIVFFGELHDNSLNHWLELQVTKDLFALKKEKLVLGAEMFEADNQTVLTEYLKGFITAKQLETEAKVWQNYQTDYKPLLDFALKNKLNFVASNIPRRYASMVSKGGLEALNQLSDDAKKNIAPLPIEVDLTLPAYAEMMKMGGMHGSGGTSISAENITKAQIIKDATMANFILKNWQQEQCFLHYNGSYHSNNFEGIVWHLKRKNPALKIVTINTIEESDIEHPSDKAKNSADFIIAIPDDMTKSY